MYEISSRFLRQTGGFWGLQILPQYVQDSSEFAGGLRFRKIVVERVTVVKFRVDNRGSDGAGCFRIEVRTNTAELSDMRIAGLRK